MLPTNLLTFLRDTLLVAKLAGYSAGGIASGGVVSTVDKFAFSNDARSTLGTGLSSARGVPASFSSSTAGYVAGGATSLSPLASSTTIDKFALVDDSRSTLATGLLTAGFSFANGNFASSTAGYVAGGEAPGISPRSTVEKFAFSNDGRSILATGLTGNRTAAACFSSSTAGYVGGGATTDDGSTAQSNIDKFAFSNDARSAVSAGLSGNRSRFTGISSSSAGYFAGGLNSSGTKLTTVDKILFADDTRSTLGTGLPAIRWLVGSFQSSDAGYILGGFDNSNALVSTVYKLNFSTEVFTTLGTGLSAATRNMGGFA